MNPTVDPALKSWIEASPESDFSIQNLPYGVFSRAGQQPRVGAAIGNQIVDLAVLHSAGLLPHVERDVFSSRYLNEFMALGRKAWRETRERLSSLLEQSSPALRDNAELRERALAPAAESRLYLPVRIGAFVDFYSSEHHATNVGSMFRPDSPLMANWKHLPVAYNGRASSVVLSGTDIRRPTGQTNPSDSPEPVFGPSRRLDFELEVGFFTGKDNPLGMQVSTEEAEDFIFGLVLVNDWSARDIQKWEYQPLGPFLAKSFGTSISPWVVPLEALEPWRVPGPPQEPPVLPYLRSERDWALDLQLEVSLQTEKMTRPQVICRTNFRDMYWNMAQQLAHQCVNGTNVQVGDLYASGTVSGRFWDEKEPRPEPDALGSLLELAWGGKCPLVVSETGEERSFLEDGDTVVMAGWCQGDGYRVGFGEVAGKVLPAAR